MTTHVRPHPIAQPHGDLVELLPDLFFVSGTIQLPGRLPIRFSRNMVVVRRGERLILVNTVRLNDRGLAALDKLGKVTDVIRLAAFHGMDDPFYAEKYGAKVWSVAGQRYTSGFDTKGDAFFEPHHEVTAGGALPLDGTMIVIDSTPPEGLLLLPDGGGTLITGDALQNWAGSDQYFSGLAKIMMRLLGFVKAHNIGPGWLKQTKPPKDQLRALKDRAFANVLPAHGTPVLGDAVAKYSPAIDRATR